MNLANLENEQLKDTLKQAIRELIQEDKALFSDLITEAIEDVALVNAIKQREDSPSISREAIFSFLKSSDVSLLDIMDGMSQEAEERGLTPEILETLLQDE